MNKKTQKLSTENVSSKKERNVLYDAFLSLKTREECAAFLRDICTRAEIQALQERFVAARLIAEGRSYRDISDTTGASTTTVTRVAHWLNHGMGGYRTVISRINKK